VRCISGALRAICPTFGSGRRGLREIETTRMTALVAALQNSLRGLRFAGRTERAVRQELVLLAIGIPCAVLVATGLWVAVALVAALLLILTVELLNTAIEKLCDHVTPEHHPTIGAVKDVGSAAALASQGIATLVWAAALAEALLR
jgi:diacylglycerol kinase (ATP)